MRPFATILPAHPTHITYRLDACPAGALAAVANKTQQAADPQARQHDQPRHTWTADQHADSAEPLQPPGTQLQQPAHHANGHSTDPSSHASSSHGGPLAALEGVQLACHAVPAASHLGLADPSHAVQEGQHAQPQPPLQHSADDEQLQHRERLLSHSGASSSNGASHPPAPGAGVHGQQRHSSDAASAPPVSLPAGGASNDPAGDPADGTTAAGSTAHAAASAAWAGQPGVVGGKVPTVGMRMFRPAAASTAGGHRRWWERKAGSARCGALLAQLLAPFCAASRPVSSGAALLCAT